MVQPVTLSIDVGTTTLVAARADESGETEVVVHEPSTVSVDGDTVMVGASALEIAAAHPDATVNQLVRRVGDSSPVVLGGRAFGVPELLGHVTRHAVATAGLDPTTSRLVLTHPASWRDHRLELLRSVGRTTGFSTVDLVSEPLAAAFRNHGQTADGPTLVVDVGGGTSDATLVGRGPSGIDELIATQSLERLGGGDFDQAVFQHVSAAVDDMISALDRRDPAVRAGITALRSACSSAKERLSAETDASIDLALPGLNTTVRITRAEFESLIRPQIDALVALVHRVLAAATLTPSDLAAIVVVGGSAPIPLLSELLAGDLGRGVTLGAEPDTAVALGAATYPSPGDPTDTTTATAPPTSKEEGQAMSNDTSVPTDSDASSAEASASTTGRTPPPPPPPAEHGGPSTGSKVAAGAVAAAAAAAVGVLFGDDIADALTGDDTQSTPDAADSMDEFDAVAGTEAGPVGEPFDVDTGGSGGPEGGSAAGSSPGSGPVGRPARPSDRDDAGTGRSEAPPVREPAPRREAAAAEPQPTGPTAPTAEPGPVGQPDVADNPAFEAARATLLQRLESFEAPPGTSPEDAAALRQELADAVESFQPRPGQTTEEALAALRDDVDERVQDFVQDQKIDTLIEEVEADNQAEAAAAAAAAAAADAVSTPDETDADAGVVTTDTPDAVAPEEPAPSTDPADAVAPEDPAPPTDTTDAIAPEEPAPSTDPADAVAPEEPAATADAAGAAAPDAPITDIPTDDIPIRDIPIRDIPIRDLPSDDIPSDDIPSDDIPTHVGPAGPVDPDVPSAEAVELGIEDDFDAAVIQFERPPNAAFAVDEPLVVDTGGVDAQPAAMADVVGESVYADVIETAPLITEPLTVGPDTIGPVDLAAPVAEVPQLPEGFEHPVYIEPEPIDIGHLHALPEDVGDFNIQGLEDEGDLAVLDSDDSDVFE